MYRLELSRILFWPVTGYLANAEYPANYSISGRINGDLTLEISRISGIRKVSRSGIRSDIENGRISGKTMEGEVVN